MDDIEKEGEGYLRQSTFHIKKDMIKSKRKAKIQQDSDVQATRDMELK